MSYEAVAAATKSGKTDKTNVERPSLVFEDDALISRAQEGNQWALEELVRRYQDRAFAIAFHLSSGDREEALDVIQDAFLRVFQKIGTFQGKSSFYTWFYRIVVNVALDRKRRRWRWDRILFRRHGPGGHEGPLSPPEERPDRRTASNPAEMLREKQLTGELQAAMGNLSEKQRTVFQLKVLHGLTIPEISQILGTAEGTVKSHLFRATQFLKQALKDWAEP